jgi:alanyl-tRNA synthetase
VKNPRVQEAVQKMFAENEALAKEIAALHKSKIEEMAAKITAELQRHATGEVIEVRQRLDMKPELVRTLMQTLRARNPKIVMVVGTESEGRPTLAIALGDEIVARGVNAGAVVREAAREIDGSGGGQPFFAMAGGKNLSGLERALDKAIVFIKT